MKRPSTRPSWNPDATKMAGRFRLEVAVLVGVQVNRVGIQTFHHPAQRITQQLVFRDFRDVVSVDLPKHTVQTLGATVTVVVAVVKSGHPNGDTNHHAGDQAD